VKWAPWKRNSPQKKWQDLIDWWTNLDINYRILLFTQTVLLILKANVQNTPTHVNSQCELTHDSVKFAWVNSQKKHTKTQRELTHAGFVSSILCYFVIGLKVLTCHCVNSLICKLQHQLPSLESIRCAQYDN